MSEQIKLVSKDTGAEVVVDYDVYSSMLKSSYGGDVDSLMRSFDVYPYDEDEEFSEDEGSYDSDVSRDENVVHKTTNEDRKKWAKEQFEGSGFSKLPTSNALGFGNNLGEVYANMASKQFPYIIDELMRNGEGNIGNLITAGVKDVGSMPGRFFMPMSDMGKTAEEENGIIAKMIKDPLLIPGLFTGAQSMAAKTLLGKLALGGIGGGALGYTQSATEQPGYGSDDPNKNVKSALTGAAFGAGTEFLANAGPKMLSMIKEFFKKKYYMALTDQQAYAIANRAFRSDSRTLTEEETKMMANGEYPEVFEELMNNLTPEQIRSSLADAEKAVKNFEELPIESQLRNEPGVMQGVRYVDQASLGKYRTEIEKELEQQISMEKKALERLNSEMKALESEKGASEDVVREYRSRKLATEERIKEYERQKKELAGDFEESVPSSPSQGSYQKGVDFRTYVPPGPQPKDFPYNIYYDGAEQSIDRAIKGERSVIPFIDEEIRNAEQKSAEVGTSIGKKAAEISEVEGNIGKVIKGIESEKGERSKNYSKGMPSYYFRSAEKVDADALSEQFQKDFQKNMEIANAEQTSSRRISSSGRTRRKSNDGPYVATPDQRGHRGEYYQQKLYDMVASKSRLAHLTGGTAEPLTNKEIVAVLDEMASYNELEYMDALLDACKWLSESEKQGMRNSVVKRKAFKNLDDSYSTPIKGAESDEGSIGAIGAGLRMTPYIGKGLLTFDMLKALSKKRNGLPSHITPEATKAYNALKSMREYENMDWNGIRQLFGNDEWEKILKDKEVLAFIKSEILSGGRSLDYGEISKMVKPGSDNKKR